MKDCIFCKISRGEIEREKIYENDNFFSIKDDFPKIKNHSLVISKKHFKTFLDVPDTMAQEFFDCVKKTTLELMKEKNVEGFNLVNNNFEVGGQVVNHIHFHILPRKKGDGFNLL